MGSNMAENHPVGFQWVMEAKRRGARIIHVDPRFSRTSAMAHDHVALRAGSDIAFLGALINYAITNDRCFREYVCAYTNAITIVSDDFRDTEDLDGLFSGFESEGCKYALGSWQYKGFEAGAAAGHRELMGEQAHGAHGGHLAHGDPPYVDHTLEDPRCVFQILKRHFSRYTPEMVEEVCGVPRERFRAVAEAVCDNSGRERTTAFVCGPDRMMQATARTLAASGVAPERTWLTLERNMACGVGVCGHCQLGPYFVCRDGPVFSVAELGDTFSVEGR